MPDAIVDVRSSHYGTGDRDLGSLGAGHDDSVSGGDVVVPQAHPLDQKAGRDELRMLLGWYYYERDRQALNRLEQAIDHDFYDNKQWSDDDEAELEDRGQAPLVYNEVAPASDWLIGTERRNRVDWKVYPRGEEDVEIADIKTKVLKYVSDINRVPLARSLAFEDAIKGGVGWVDDGVRDDPTKDILYSRHETWRCVLHDSAAHEMDLSDARYIFRWRWVDEDVALMMFPDRQDAIRRACEEAAYHSDPEEDEELIVGTAQTGLNPLRTGTLYASGSSIVTDAKRRRVKLIECQYRKPAKAKIVTSGPLAGAFFDSRDATLNHALGRVGGTIIEKVTMRMHVAIFTETHMLGMGPSIFRHNSFTLTPVWCYRRNRDRMPYGVIRRVRDIQRDLNKRASKALWLLNTNQLMGEEGAVDDWDEAHYQAQQPDGRIVVRNGRRLEIRRDTDAATGQLQIMTMDAQSIQKSAGVSQENLGRQTNAVSGEAIKARQIQGSVVTTQPFDNLRWATQWQGEKQLSLVEQFYSQEKVFRLTSSRGAIQEWVKVNTPEQQPDGSWRVLNDITASMADFRVGEQDYAGTLRQVMFDSLNSLAQRLPPEVSLRLMTIAMDFSDLPNKDEVADAIRRLTGERDPNKPMTPEEAQQAEQQAAVQADALQMQRESAIAALEEQRAKAREINAKAAKIEAESALMGGDGQAQASIEDAVRQTQAAADRELERLSDALRKAQGELANRTLQIKSDADSAANAAQLKYDAEVRVAEIAAASDKQMDSLIKRMDAIARGVEDLRTDTRRQVDDVAKQVRSEMAVDKAQTAAVPAAAPAAAPVAPPAVPITLVMAPPAAAKQIQVVYGADGKPVGADIMRDDGTTQHVALQASPANPRKA